MLIRRKQRRALTCLLAALKCLHVSHSLPMMGHNPAPQWEAKWLSDIDPYTALPQSMRSTKSLLYPVCLSIMTYHTACLAQLGSNAGFCYRCFMQEGSKMTGFNPVWWKFDRHCWLSSTLHGKKSKIYFNSIGSDVELGNVPSLVVNSQHHLLVPLQRGDFASSPFKYRGSFLPAEHS